MRYACILTMLITLAVSGCGGVHNVPAEKAARAAASKDAPGHAATNESLLAYFGYVRKLPPAQLARELEASRQSYAASRSDYERMRYAMVLSIPGSAVYDDVRALDAIEPLLKNQNSPMHGLAFMVNAQIQEQRRSQGLQQKLDALKSIEKTLIERDTGGARKK